MSANSEARKRADEDAQARAAAPLLLLDDVRRALADVYPGAETQDASALLDQLEDVGLRVVRA